VDSEFDTVATIAAYCQMLDDETEAFGEPVIDRVDTADAFRAHTSRLHSRTEREHGEHDELVRRVVPVHIEARVRLRVALGLRLSHRIVELHSIRAHSGQDVVARAVHDPLEPYDPITRERLAQDPDDRDAAPDGPLECEIDAARNGPVDERGPVHRQQHLVGCHDAPVGVEGALHVGSRRIDPAHHLDEHVDGCVPQNRFRVRRESRMVKLRDALLANIAHQDARDLQWRADALREIPSVGSNQANDTSADGAAPEQSETDRLHPRVISRGDQGLRAPPRP
jgi:hypothetical protein